MFPKFLKTLEPSIPAFEYIGKADAGSYQRNSSM